MKCTACDNQVEEERLELLETTICAACAKAGIGQEEVRAATFYNNDGTSDIQIMNKRQFDKFLRDDNNRAQAHL